MSWEETTPGVFRHEYGKVEQVYRNISTLFLPLHKEHWVIHCVVTLHDLRNNFAETLRKAWRLLRFEYPDIGIVPDGLTHKTYSPVNDEPALEEWVNQTFFIQSQGTANEISAAAKPNVFPTLHYFPATREVLFLSSHWRIDGVGTLIVLNRLFSLVAGDGDASNILPLGTDLSSKLAPCLEDALDAATEYTEEMKTYARESIAEFHKKAVQKASFPYNGDLKTPPARSLHETLRFSAASTSRIVAACKQHQISVTSAVHAALAEVYFAYGGAADESDYTTATSVNMRNYLPASFDTNPAAHPFQPYVTSITPTVRRASSFADRTVALTKDYTNWYNDEFRKCLRLIYQYHAEALTTRPAPGAPPRAPPSGLSVSSLGRVEKLLETEFGGGIVKLKDFHFGVSMLTRQILLYVWTFEGGLTLSLNYNDAYYQQETVRDVLRRMREALETGLGLELELETELETELV
ncbi:hypothetical protein BJX70DRAFT_68514 [Aspergillus crustosus]